MNYTQLQISRLIMTFEQLASTGYMSCSAHNPLVPVRLYDQWSSPNLWLQWLTTTPWENVLMHTETIPRHVRLLVSEYESVKLTGQQSLTFRLKTYSGLILTAVVADKPTGVIPYVSASVSLPVKQTYLTT